MHSTSPKGRTARIARLPLRKRAIKLFGRAVFWAMWHLSSLLRPWSINLLGAAFGNFFYIASRRYRNVALRNLRAVYGLEMSEREIRALARAVFRHFATGAFEFFRLLSLSPEQVDAMMDLEGTEHIDGALAEGRGCIVVTAHYGNWELLARRLTRLGYVINVIARDSDDPGMTGIATRIRENGGYRVFDRDQPMIGVFRCLRRNECLGILPDQHESTGIFVDFFSRPAATATGPALISLRTGAPIVPAFAEKLPDGRYRGTIHPRLNFVPKGDEDRDVRELTALINSAIERQIRANPSQWLWFHDRWKSTPEDGTDGR